MSCGSILKQRARRRMGGSVKDSFQPRQSRMAWLGQASDRRDVATQLEALSIDSTNRSSGVCHGGCGSVHIWTQRATQLHSDVSLVYSQLPVRAGIA
eukprot:3940333-Rhodomonas_salina.2